MRVAAALIALAAGLAFPAGAHASAWNPAADYISPGQDEPGYRNWYAAAPWHATHVRAFNTYLETYGVGGVVPTWQLLRTATSWHKCGAQPFEVPPTDRWPQIVQTLRYVRDFVVPEVGPVEPVSGYRNPHLNVCAGGAPDSAHKHYSAIDMVPLRPTTRAELMHRLCTTHAVRGPQYHTGLGFYAFVRFHVDSTRFRRWGTDSMPGAPPCPAITSEPALAAAKDMPAWAGQPPEHPSEAVNIPAMQIPDNRRQ